MSGLSPITSDLPLPAQRVSAIASQLATSIVPTINTMSETTPPTVQKDPITCHVLDTVTGRPAANLQVSLTLLQPLGPSAPWQATTNDDGRIANWRPMPGPTLHEIFQNISEENGGGQMVWALKFDTGNYFGEGKTFFPEVEIRFFRVGASSKMNLAPFNIAIVRPGAPKDPYHSKVQSSLVTIDRPPSRPKKPVLRKRPHSQRPIDRPNLPTLHEWPLPEDLLEQVPGQPVGILPNLQERQHRVERFKNSLRLPVPGPKSDKCIRFIGPFHLGKLNCLIALSAPIRDKRDSAATRRRPLGARSVLLLGDLPEGEIRTEVDEGDKLSLMRLVSLYRFAEKMAVLWLKNDVINIVIERAVCDAIEGSVMEICKTWEAAPLKSDLRGLLADVYAWETSPPQMESDQEELDIDFMVGRPFDVRDVYLKDDAHKYTLTDGRDDSVQQKGKRPQRRVCSTIHVEPLLIP
ncbi:MAG: hypothetical protein M1812_007738 [Candelaria pacifica]|nr:MAG: hypothetical protein M1812_007738 [Candelaria pacifica]